MNLEKKFKRYNFKTLMENFVSNNRANPQSEYQRLNIAMKNGSVELPKNIFRGNLHFVHQACQKTVKIQSAKGYGVKRHSKAIALGTPETQTPILNHKNYKK